MNVICFVLADQPIVFRWLRGNFPLCCCLEKLNAIRDISEIVLLSPDPKYTKEFFDRHCQLIDKRCACREFVVPRLPLIQLGKDLNDHHADVMLIVRPTFIFLTSERMEAVLHTAAYQKQDATIAYGTWSIQFFVNKYTTIEQPGYVDGCVALRGIENRLKMIPVSFMETLDISDPDALNLVEATYWLP